MLYLAEFRHYRSEIRPTDRDNEVYTSRTSIIKNNMMRIRDKIQSASIYISMLSNQGEDIRALKSALELYYYLLVDINDGSQLQNLNL